MGKSFKRGQGAAKKPAMAGPPPPRGKNPQIAPDPRPDVGRRFPTWKFEHADHDGQWTFSVLDGDELVVLMQKLRDFERMTINELFNGGHPGKQYDVQDLPRPAQDRLAAIDREDETRVARLRLTGPQRLYGFMREEVFNVLWWDPNHTVFPSQKKHT